MYGIRDIRFFGEAYVFGCGHFPYTGGGLCLSEHAPAQPVGDIGGAAQAGASMVDTAANNLTNIYLQKQAQGFNAQQAATQRAWETGMTDRQDRFNAWQAQDNRDFQAEQTQEAQSYATKMSDTAIQRRSADIQKAGFNPLLAVGALGGASSPVVAAPGGAQASGGIPTGSSATSPGPAHVQPFMPGIVDALNAQSQRGNLQAQANKAQSEANINNATLPYSGLQAAANLSRTNQDINTLVAQANKYLSEYDINETTLPTLLQDRQFRAQLQTGLMELQALDIQAKRYGNAEGAARADVFNSPLGRVLVAAGLGHQAGGDIGAAAATASWQLLQNPLKPSTKSAMGVKIADPTGQNFMLEQSGIGAPTP